MITRTSDYYDIMALGLGGAKDYQEFVDTMFADKYNAPQTDGFDWDPMIQIDFTYEQLQAELGIYAMATFVDIDSPGGTHSPAATAVSSGKIPRFKHQYIIDEKIIREQMVLAQRFGSVTPVMREQLARILFNNTDKLIGGNYNTLTYQRHQAISTGQFAITSTNNPAGIQNLTFSFGVPVANQQKAGGFGANGTKYAWSSSSANPIGDLMDMVQYADDNMIPYGMFEMSKKLWNTFRSNENVKKAVATGINLNADLTNIGSMIFTDEVIKAYLRGIGLPEINIIDSLVVAEKYDVETRSIAYTQIRPFDEVKVVLRPAGQIGTIKAVEPIVLQDPSARIAMFDGGRTKLTQRFDSKNVIQTIESELTALCVPFAPKYLVQLKTDEAAT